MIGKLADWIGDYRMGSDFYETLHENIGMTDDEIREVGYGHLSDSFGETEDAIARLRYKVYANYEDYKAKWLQMTPGQLIEQAKEIGSIKFMRDALLKSVTQEDAEFLLQFKNPLELMSNYWLRFSGPDAVDFSDDISYILMHLSDGAFDPTEYEMEQEEPEFSAPEMML